MTPIQRRLQDLKMCQTIFAPMALCGLLTGCAESQSGPPPADQVIISAARDGGLRSDGGLANPPTDCTAAAATGLYGKTILCVPTFTPAAYAGWQADGKHNTFPTCWANTSDSLAMTVPMNLANGHCAIVSPNLDLGKYDTITVAISYKTSGFQLAFNGASIVAYIGNDPFVPVAPLVTLADSANNTTLVFSFPRKMVSVGPPVLVLSYDIASGPMMSEVLWTIESLAILGSNS